MKNPPTPFREFVLWRLSRLGKLARPNALQQRVMAFLGTYVAKRAASWKAEQVPLYFGFALTEIGLNLLRHPSRPLQDAGRTLTFLADPEDLSYCLPLVLAKTSDLGAADRLIGAAAVNTPRAQGDLFIALATHETLAPLLARHNPALEMPEFHRYQEEDGPGWMQATGWLLKHAHPAGLRHYLSQTRRPLTQPLLSCGNSTHSMEWYSAPHDPTHQPGLLQAALMWLANPPAGCNAQWLAENVLLLLEHEGHTDIPDDSTEKRTIAELAALPGIPEDVRQAIGFHLDRSRKMAALAGRMDKFATDWVSQLPSGTRVGILELETVLGLPIPWLEPVRVDGETRPLFDWFIAQGQRQLIAQEQKQLTPELRTLLNGEPEPLRQALAQRLFCQCARNARCLLTLAVEFDVPGNTETLTHLLNYMSHGSADDKAEVRQILDLWQPDWHGKDQKALEHVLRYSPASSLEFLLDTGFDPNREFNLPDTLAHGKNGFELLLGELSRWNALDNATTFEAKWHTLWPLRSEEAVLRLPEALEKALACPALEHEEGVLGLLSETLALLSQQRLDSVMPESAPTAPTAPTAGRRRL